MNVFDEMLSPIRCEQVRQELKPILVLLQRARSHSMLNNHHMVRNDLQVALAKYETIFPVLNRVLEAKCLT